MQNYLELFSDSYARVTQLTKDGMGFFEAFYARFVGTSTEVAEKFQGVDMVAQREHLKNSLEHMLYFSIDRTASDELRRVAARHSKAGRGIQPEMYQLWLNALLLTVEAFDTQYDEEIELAWRVILAPGIAYMSSLYDAQSAGAG